MEDADVVPFAPASHIPLAPWSSKHRDALVFVLAGLVAVTLSACGSGSTNPPATRPSTTTGSPSTTPTSKPSVALPPTTTPTTEAPTTAPPTTTPTTEAPTTAPPTTTPTTEAPTTAPPTTTSSAESTSSTIAAATPSGGLTSSTPWGWIVVGIVLAAGLIVGVVLLLQARSRRAALVTWRRDAGPALQQAMVARDLLIRDGTDVEPERREAVSTQVENAAKILDGLVTSAPDDATRHAASSSAAALRGLMFASEADRLLHSREKSPTADELAEADEARRDRVRELNTALDELTMQVEPEEAAVSSQGGPQ